MGRDLSNCYIGCAVLSSPSNVGSTLLTSTPKPLVSVIVLTFNEEKNLPDCIKSLSGLNCELYVVDSGSTDATLQIAAASNASIQHHPFDNYSRQRNWAQ